MKKYISSFLLALLVLTTALNCNATDPEENEIKPGRRDYEWTVDTLNYPYNIIYRIWGSSPTNVWVTSPGGDLDKTIFHFDGIKWTTDGISRPISPHSIFGFGPDNIIIGGLDGRIWKYDGDIWTELIVLSKNGEKRIVFDNIWGESANNFYAFGACPDNDGYSNNGTIAHYINGSWTFQNTDQLQGKGIIEDLYKSKADNKIFLRTLQWNKGINFDSIMIYEYDNIRYKKIYSGTWDFDSASDISMINNEVIFALGNSIAKRRNEEFITILTIDKPNFYNQIWGRNLEDIFLKMTDGLAHYNGTNIDYLIRFEKERTQVFGAMLFEKEVFFIVYEAQTNLNLIYHGKLK